MAAQKFSTDPGTSRSKGNFKTYLSSASESECRLDGDRERCDKSEKLGKSEKLEQIPVIALT